jgi:hypothetical protein
VAEINRNNGRMFQKNGFIHRVSRKGIGSVKSAGPIDYAKIVSLKFDNVTSKLLAFHRGGKDSGKGFVIGKNIEFTTIKVMIEMVNSPNNT